MERVPFLEAVNDEMLLKNFFHGDGTKQNKGLTFPQKVALKALYGCELSPKIINEQTGWSELDYWALVQGSFEQDELGYPTKIIPMEYIPKEYDQMWAVVGRRAGKTSALQSLIIAYEATLGGHEEYIAKGQECLIYLVAQRLDVATLNMPFITSILNSSPLLAKQIVRDINGLVELKNGIKIVPSPPSIKAQRGLACPVVAMDEVSFWYKDAENANPDFEVERAVSWAQLQFPHFKRIGISSPWSKEGLLWKYHKAGTEGRLLSPEEREEYKDILVCFGTSASFENPIISRDRLAKEKVKDREGFERESLCIFPDSVSGFLSRSLVEEASKKAKNITERPPVDWEKSKIIPYYVAAMDPGFRNDSFTFCIVHKDEKNNIVVDVLRRWTPMKGQKNDPKMILTQIKQLADQYKVDIVYSDQGQLESLQALALDMDLMVVGEDFTSKSKPKILNTLQQIINQQKLITLDDTLSPEAKVLNQELIQLERTQTGMGNMKIAAPNGKHDDMAMVMALACYKTIRTSPSVTEEVVYQEPSIFDLAMGTLKNKRLQQEDFF